MTAAILVMCRRIDACGEVLFCCTRKCRNSYSFSPEQLVCIKLHIYPVFYINDFNDSTAHPTILAYDDKEYEAIIRRKDALRDYHSRFLVFYKPFNDTVLEDSNIFDATKRLQDFSE